MESVHSPCHPKDCGTVGDGVSSARGILEAPRGWFSEANGRVLNNAIFKDEKHIYITCETAKFWSKDAFIDKEKVFKKDNPHLGILMNF